MMKESTRNLWVGVFVVFSLGALGVLMIWFGEAPSWLRSSEWTLRITDVRDLQGVGEGSVVNLNGVEIGRVKALEFAQPDRPDQGVVILAGIKRKYTVPRGATASVYGAMLGFGGGRIEIVVEPGQDLVPLPEDDAEITGVMRSVVGDLISADLVNSVERSITNFGNFTHEWTPVGSNLSKMLEQRTVDDVDRPGADAQGLSPNLSTVVERFDDLMAHLNVVLGDTNVQGDVKSVVSDLRLTAENFRELVTLWTAETRRLADNLNEGIDGTEGNLNESFRRLNGILENLDDVTGDLTKLSAQLAEGHGTIGLLARDPRLYEAAVLSLERFSEVMLNLQVITGKVKEDGYIVIGQAPSGFWRKEFDVPGQATDSK